MNTASNTVGLVPATYLVGRGVFIELLRRKVFYVLLILMALYVLGVVVVGIVGIENASTATFLMNLGLTLAWLAGHAVTLVLSVRQIPDEIENRTLYPMLARPIGRHVLLFGKWLACAAAGFVVLATLGLMAWVAVPKLEAYRFTMLLQGVVLHGCSLLALSALGVALSLMMPRGVAMILLSVIALGGSKLASLAESATIGSSAVGAVRWVMAYVPDFSRLNLVTRYTDGIAPLGVGEFLGLVLYGALIAAFAYSVAAALFQRRPL